MLITNIKFLNINNLINSRYYARMIASDKTGSMEDGRSARLNTVLAVNIQ